MSRRPLFLIAPFLFSLIAAGSVSICLPAAQAPTVSEVQEKLKKLEERIEALCTQDKAKGPLWNDAEVFHKGVVWALRYDKDFSAADLTLIKRSIDRGMERLNAIESEKADWPSKKGRLVRGYQSQVDGSIQPYCLVIPKSYDPSKPIRLDVVLHGSTRPVGLSELRFMAPFDQGDEGGAAPDVPYIELHPLGRVENCYRWAGEADVFEAIEDVCSKYKIDRDRIVLRGMSMGASGTWHLGLKHPDYFVALGPYCGYVDTHRFSETPGMNFVKVGPLPEYQEMGLHMLDSVDYAANAGIVPCIAAIGEKDPFFQAHVIMGEAMASEGLKMVNLVSPGTAHVQDPPTWGEQMRRIGEYADKGLDHRPKHIRFVTWTLKYNRCHWLSVLSLEQHYKRAEIEATCEIVGDIKTDTVISIKEPVNIDRFAVERAGQAISRGYRISIAGQNVPIPKLTDGGSGPVSGIEFAKRDGKWTCFGDVGGYKLPLVKTSETQGPIDDAFTREFTCVRGTGKAWNSAVQRWADADLWRFTYEWNRYFRGDAALKDDKAVSASDLEHNNLILFGDPGSNEVLRRILPKLPIRWTPKYLDFNGKRCSSADHAPLLIFPSPFSRLEKRYIVINSGHTFHESELNRLNYLLFPRLGDWAVVKVGDKQPSNPSEPLSEQVVEAGYFDENWKFPKPKVTTH